MAEDSDLERTEAATPRRLEQAREEGQIARSPELTTFAVLLTAGLAMLFLGSTLIRGLERMMEQALWVDRATAFRSEAMIARLYEGMVAVLIDLAPFFALLVLAAIVAPMLVSGWLFTFEAVAPKFTRINPLTGLGRIFSAHGAVELAKAILKAVLVGGVAAWVIYSEFQPLIGLASEPARPGIAHLGELIIVAFLMVVGAMALIVVVDVPFQIWDHARQLRMTKEEVKQELKETEGDPQIRARIRQLQRERARRRMMAEVPKADVVVTNPTRYAVALRYRSGAMRAPTVVASGSALLAERIREVAIANRVPVVQAPPLARALHAHAELGQEIPTALYTAVAEVLAYVYQLRRFETEGGDAPTLPETLPVPAELDPEIEPEGEPS